MLTIWPGGEYGRQITAEGDPMERLARLVMHHRRLVTAFWLVLFIAGAASAGQLSNRLTIDFTLPGQPGDTAENLLVDTYGASSFDTYIAVLTVPAGQTVEQNKAKVAAVFDGVEQALPVSRMVDYQSTGDQGFISDDGRTTFALIQGPLPESFGPGIETKIEPALTAGAEQAGFTSGLTSYGLLSAGGDTSGPSVLVETLFGAAGALLVLIFVFAS